MDPNLWPGPAKIARRTLDATDGQAQSATARDADQSRLRDPDRAGWANHFRRRSREPHRRLARGGGVERPAGGPAGLRPSEGSEVGRGRKRRKVGVNAGHLIRLEIRECVLHRGCFVTATITKSLVTRWRKQLPCRSGFCFLPPRLLFLSSGNWRRASRQNLQPSGVSIVQPGAPGKSNKTLDAGDCECATRESPPRPTSKFMQGMIMHHSQAVEMTELLRTRSQDKEVQALGKRISISQTDEMAYMKQWLTDRGEPISEHGSMDMAGMDMAGMDHMDMGSMPMMPGMLTPEQMKALAAATGPEFDHLFLTGMIQHHTGALTMVKELVRDAGSRPGSPAIRFRKRRRQHPAGGDRHHAAHAKGETMIAETNLTVFAQLPLTMALALSVRHSCLRYAPGKTTPSVYTNPRAGADDPRVGLKAGLYDAGEAAFGSGADYLVAEAGWVRSRPCFDRCLRCCSRTATTACRRTAGSRAAEWSSCQLRRHQLRSGLRRHDPLCREL